MILYILCSTPCAIKCDGKYLGCVGDDYGILETDECYLEFIPLDNSYLQTGLLIRGKPVRRGDVAVYDLDGGYLVAPSFSRKLVTDYRLIGKAAIPFSRGKVIAALESENGIKLSVYTEKSFARENLPIPADSVKFDRVAGGGKEYLIAYVTGRRTAVFGFEISDDVVLRFKNACDSYSFVNGNLALTELKGDVMLHTVTSVWRFGNTVDCVKFDIKARRAAYSLPEKLIPIAFFEQILIGGDPSDFLSPRLKARAAEAADFIGEFSAVLPPPHFKSDKSAMLLCTDRVRYAETDVVGGAIDGIRLSD